MRAPGMTQPMAPVHVPAAPRQQPGPPAGRRVTAPPLPPRRAPAAGASSADRARVAPHAASAPLATSDDPWIGAPASGGFQLGVDAVATLRLLLQERLRIGILTMVAVAAGLVLTFLSPSEYKSTVELLPSTADNGFGAVGLGQAAGLASTLGINLGTPSVAMAYPDILKSRQIRERVVDRTFRTVSGASSTLQQILVANGKVSEVQRAKALGELDKRVRVGVDKMTGVMELTLTMREAGLAQDVARAYVEELVRIEEELKASNARANKEFIEKRLGETKVTLATAENALKDFQEQNLRLGNDPELQLECARLQRRVRIQEEVYLTLTRQYELAKIEENHQDADVQVIDPPQLPLMRSSPILLKNLALSAFLGFVGASILVIAFSWWSAGRRQFDVATARG